MGGACGFLHTPPRPATEPRCTRHGWAQRELASPRGDQPDIVMSCRRSVVNPRTPLRAPVAAATLRLLLNYRCSSACQAMPILSHTKSLLLAGCSWGPPDNHRRVGWDHPGTHKVVASSWLPTASWELISTTSRDGEGTTAKAEGSAVNTV